MKDTYNELLKELSLSLSLSLSLPLSLSLSLSLSPFSLSPLFLSLSHELGNIARMRQWTDCLRA